MMTETEPSSPTSTSSGELSPQKMDDKTSYRKSNKPLMEKKRRARINSCLSQLKSLVLQAMKKDNSQYSKLEKADILELTVKHLKNVQRYQANSMAQVPDAMNKYRAGFNECANEVMRYLGESQGVNDDARTRILSHLASILTPINTLPLQPAHTPILPAPSPAQQQQHLQQLQLQQQQQQSVFLTPPNQPLSIDTNNNKPAQSSFLPHSNSVGDIKHVISGSPTAFQSPIGTGISASAGLQLPCIATASMATAQLQLVPSTLPSGQVALVLAPQAIPAMNLYTSPQSNRQQPLNHEAMKLVTDPAIQQKLGHGTTNINQSQPHMTRMEECKSRLSSNQSPVSLVTKPSQMPRMETSSSSAPYAHAAPSHHARPAPTVASPLSSSSSMPTNATSKYNVNDALILAHRSKAAATSVIINNINNNNNMSGSVVRATSTWRPW